MKLNGLIAFALALVLAGSLFAAAPARGESGVSLMDDRYQISPQTVHMTVTNEGINTVKSGVFGANNGYRAGGYGIYDEATQAFNESMLAAIRGSGVTHIRQPGGIEGDYFHWYETVGPAEDRIPQVNPFSSHYPTYARKDGELYDVAFGPDEWMEACSLTGTALTIQLNTGNGTPQEAVDFIRYCLDKGVAIESIAVGNESHMEEERVAGIAVTKTPEEYIAFYNEVLSLMGEEMIARLDARGIPFGCIGLPTSHILSVHRKWDATVLPALAVPADFIDIHIGYTPYDVNLGAVAQEDIHLILLASHQYVQLLLGQEVKTIAAKSPDTLIKISEFGLLGKHCGGTAGALYLASFFQTALNEERVFSADFLPLCFSPNSTTSIIGADVAADRYWMNVGSHVFRLYADQIGRTVLRVTCENSQQFKARAVGLIPRQLKVNEADGAVYYDEAAGEGSLFLINRAYMQNTNFAIQLPFENVRVTQVTELWHADYSKANTRNEMEAVAPVAMDVDMTLADGFLTVCAKPVSLVKIDFSVE